MQQVWGIRHPSRHPVSWNMCTSSRITTLPFSQALVKFPAVSDQCTHTHVSIMVFTPSNTWILNKLWFFKLSDSELTKSTAAPQTDTYRDRLTKHCSNEQQFPWQLWGKAGEAVTGWQAGSGRTISEGLKGFPWPLMPPEILKPRPGFFSILTHNWRKRRKTKQNRQKQIKEKQSESEMQRSEQSLREHREDSVYVEACFYVPCETFCQLCWRSAVRSHRSPQSQFDRMDVNNS